MKEKNEAATAAWCGLKVSVGVRTGRKPEGVCWELAKFCILTQAMVTWIYTQYSLSYTLMMCTP